MHKADHRREMAGKPAGKEPSIVSSLVENALDYFLSAAEYAHKEDLRSLKYCVLHIAASIELALKARLFVEHWALIFADVDKATESALKDGDFRSADSQTVLERLEKIGKVVISKKDRVHLEELRKLRNCIQHFALNTTKPQASSLVAKSANFLIDFCHGELPDVLKEFDRTLQKIREHLGEFDEYVTVRLKSIKPLLEEAEYVTTCPKCWQETLRIGVGDPNCPFCGFQTEASDLAQEISETTVEECPECDEETLAFRLQTNDDGYLLCTSCGYTVEWHSACPRCGKLNVTGPLCEECAAELEEDT